MANAPSLTHKNRHATGGADALAPSDIGAATAASVTTLTTNLNNEITTARANEAILMRPVNFGSSASTSRGGSTGTVLWIGAAGVTPTNTLPGDFIANTP